MNKQRIAIILDMEQVGPDSWEQRAKTKLCDENTTLKEIEDWAKTIYKNGKTLLDSVTFSYADKE